MKKILLLFAAAVCAVASWAQDVVTAKYNGSKLDVELTNSTTFVAFQMDITVPVGLTLDGDPVSNISRLAQGENVMINTVSTPTPFQLAYNVISTDASNQVIRVIAYNLGNHEIQEATGKLFTINFEQNVTSASISNILFVDNSLAEQPLADAVAEEGAEYKVGDVNLDGSVDLKDLTRLVNVLLGSSVETVTSNVNGDASVDLKDLTRLVNILLAK